MKRFLMLCLLAAFFAGTASAEGGLKTKQNYVIGFYNLENLFDIYDDPAKNDEEFLPDGSNQWTEVKYNKKLHNIATVIADMAKSNGAFHTILGVSEIENRLVLEDLVSQPELQSAHFEIVHYDSPDRRGVDVAMLYRPDQFEYIFSESLPFSFEGTEVEITLSKEEQDYFRTRDILMVYGKIDNEDFAIYVAHLPARVGGKGGDLRSLGAEIIRKHAEKMMEQYPGVKPLTVSQILSFPGILEPKTVDIGALKQEVMNGLEQVVQILLLARSREGASLVKVVLSYCDKIEKTVNQLVPKLPNIIENIQKKLQERLSEALAKTLSERTSLTKEDINDRIRQEVILYAIKLDVDEEINRLLTHINEIRRLLKDGGEVGKKMDFMIQELNREANTLGSKASAIEMTRTSLDLKVNIEKMREQIQNLE